MKKLAGAILILCTALCARRLSAQGEPGAALAFDVASVRQNRGDDQRVRSNVPLGPGDVYVPTGGVLNAKNWPLDTYIYFAYRMTDAQVQFFRKQAPGWVLSDRFDIEAKTERADVTKDELRLMMRALLAERFGLRVHVETRELPVYELLMVKPGMTGPGLRAHTVGMECAEVGKDLSSAGKPETVAGGFVSYCGGITGLPPLEKGNYRIGASDVSMKLIADSLTLWGGLGKTAVDRTGLAGKYDFVLEYAPQGAPERDTEGGGPTFLEAVRKQLGLKLEAGRAPVELLVLDGVGRLVEN